MRRVEVHPNALHDLDEIQKNFGDEVAQLLIATIEEIIGSEEINEILLDRFIEKDGKSIQRWLSQFNRGNDLYRLKVIEANNENWFNNEEKISGFRFIYAYCRPSNSRSETYIVILAVVKRGTKNGEFNYEDEHASSTTRRIISDYKDL